MVQVMDNYDENDSITCPPLQVKFLLIKKDIRNDKIPKSDWIYDREPSYYPNLTGYENLLVFQKNGGIYKNNIKANIGARWIS